MIIYKFAYLNEIRKNKMCSGMKLESLSEKDYKEMMDIMNHLYEIRNNPKVGFFWFDIEDKVIFGETGEFVSEIKDYTYSNIVSCPMSYQKVWNDKIRSKSIDIDSKYFKGDYKDKPRGEIIYLKDIDMFYVFMDKCVYECPDVIPLINEYFNLDKPEVIDKVKWFENRDL